MAAIAPNTLKVGLFGIGLKAYWSQFDGLEARLKSYVDIVANRCIHRSGALQRAWEPCKDDRRMAGPLCRLSAP